MLHDDMNKLTERLMLASDREDYDRIGALLLGVAGVANALSAVLVRLDAIEKALPPSPPLGQEEAE